MDTAVEPAAPAAPARRRPHAAVPPAAAARRGVTARAVLLGLGGVAFVCGLTPYNDYVARNTFLVGNYLPVGLLLFFGLIVMLVNAPLHRWRPAAALTGGELAIALTMTLVSCALPSSGLMRYLPAHLTGYWHEAAQDPDHRRLLEGLALPAWLFPTSAAPTGDVAGRAADPVVRDFAARLPADAGAAEWAAVARAWLVPAATWGVLVAAVTGASLCAAAIVRPQWAENERLPFPLAGVYLALVEPPPPGRAVNALLRTGTFWAAAAAVFAVHGFNALHHYDARWPELPIRYELWSLLSDPPLDRAHWGLKAATLYFSVVGIVYFVQGSVAFSVWAVYLLFNAALVAYGAYGGEVTGGMQADQNFGAIVSYTAMILWLGRRHWATVGRHMAGRRRAGEGRGRYLSHAAAGWGLAASLAVAGAWLVAAGTSVAGAAALVATFAAVFLTMARVVAETGLMFTQVAANVAKPWEYLAAAAPGAVAPREAFVVASLNGILGHDVREAMPPFATTALRVADGAGGSGVATGAGDDAAAPGGRGGLVACLILAVAVGYVVAGASTLWVEYSYAATVDAQQQAPINLYGARMSVDAALHTAGQLAGAGGELQAAHSRAGHVAAGAAATAALAVLRVRLPWWPLHPVGYLLCYAYATHLIWFSVFVGWAAKAAVLRLGGSGMYRAARPVFLGLILGEAAAAGVWLSVSLALAAAGLPYNVVQLTPG